MICLVRYFSISIFKVLSTIDIRVYPIWSTKGSGGLPFGSDVFTLSPIDGSLENATVLDFSADRQEPLSCESREPINNQEEH